MALPVARLVVSRRLLAFTLVTAGCETSATPAPPIRGVDSVTWQIDTFPTQFSSIEQVGELSDERVVLLDRRDPAVFIVHFGSGATERVGGPGAGPGEYRRPSTLTMLGADSFVVADQGLLRYTLYAAGQPLRTTPAPSLRQYGVRAGYFGADREGRLYFTTSGAPPDTTGFVSWDSVHVLRFDPSNDGVDTVATIAHPGTARVGAGGVSNYNVSGVANLRDLPVLSRSGVLSIVRVGDYHVDFLDGRKVRRGTPVPFERKAIPPEERDRIRRSREANQQRTAARGGIAPPPPPPIPEFYAPVTAVLAAPRDRLWVGRTAAGNWDVLDSTGALLRRLRTGYPGRAVGAGMHSIYFAVEDADGLMRLIRHRIDQGQAATR